MENITDKEKLSLLGFDDPPHSLAWYKERFNNIPEVLERFIVDTVNKHNIFPKEADGLEKRIRYQNFYLTIETDKNKYMVKINDTDRGEIQKEFLFSDIKEAAKFLINKSFTTGGSINEYWNASTK